MRDYILNTIAFADQLKSGRKQEAFMESVKALGFDGVEIRSEFLQEGLKEIREIRQAAERCGLKLYYSVNDAIFLDGQINEKIQGYLQQASDMQAVHVKFNLGGFKKYQGSLKQDLKPFLSTAIEVHVENNQTKAQSALDDFLAFFQDAKANDVPITFCFDIANWYWTGVLPEDAAKKLAVSTAYLHLKNKISTNEGLKTVPLLEGDILWQDLLRYFRKDIPIALEYPGNLQSVEGGLKAVREMES